MRDFIASDYPIPWSMTTAEKCTLIQLLGKIKPKVAIEIGTFNGGSLQAISRFSDKVYAIDISPEQRDERCEKFKNVEYLIGNSKDILPQLVDEINKSDEKVEFILIDGDHSTKGVASDIENILQILPKSTITIIMHDSFNPTCRKGMSLPNYTKNPFVHEVELDFVTGAFNHDGLYREMWGGFGLIQMQPNKRTDTLSISRYQNKLYRLTYYKSMHFYRRLFGFLRPIYKVFKK
ncbi:class I SAM-dependent methyltransferase [Winogradskyella poriferorum]|uniref:class I SAM-dependent methyltransferase n=1 Tax=Winogradskyella poriferorum TaxID=307627 RepID=UPI003D659818